mgnify:CR=1 FL=1
MQRWYDASSLQWRLPNDAYASDGGLRMDAERFDDLILRLRRALD